MKEKIYALLQVRDMNALEIKEALGISESIHKYVMELESDNLIYRKRCFTDKRIYLLSIK